MTRLARLCGILFLRSKKKKRRGGADYLFVAHETDVLDFTKLREELPHLLFVKAMGDAANVDCARDEVDLCILGALLASSGDCILSCCLLVALQHLDGSEGSLVGSLCGVLWNEGDLVATLLVDILIVDVLNVVLLKVLKVVVLIVVLLGSGRLGIGSGLCNWLGSNSSLSSLCGSLSSLCGRLGSGRLGSSWLGSRSLRFCRGHVVVLKWRPAYNP